MASQSANSSVFPFASLPVLAQISEFVDGVFDDFRREDYACGASKIGMVIGLGYFATTILKK